MKARILVVDDNPTNSKLASVVLEETGYEVKQAADAEQALTIIRSFPPDLILMDIALPGMDGLTLTKNLKANQRTKDIIIVAMTAFAMKGDDKKALDAGCDAYIAKPIDTRKLPLQIAELLETSTQLKPKEFSIKKGSLTILVVEDNPINLKLLQVTLESEGIFVVKATDGVEALKVLEGGPNVNGIISDILMPNMDGYRLCHAIRKHGKYSDLPFIMYSSTHISEADKKLAIEAGADLFLEKPTPSKILIEQIMRLCSKPPLMIQRKSNVSEELTILKRYSELLIRKLEEAQLDLIESERKYRLIVENIPDAAWTLGSDGNLIFISPNIKQIYGFTSEEIYQAKENGWSKRIHPEDDSFFQEAIGLLFKQKKVFNLECRIQKKDGRWIWTSIRAIQTYEYNGDKYATGLISDITHRRQTDEALKERITELQHFKDVTVGREDRMIELKKEVNLLSKELGREEPYDLTFNDLG